MKRPAFQFYPADWRKDPALSSCSLAARGLWIELMCIAHESDRYGHLAVNGRPMESKQIARMVGESPAAVAKLLAELETAGVFSRSGDDAIYSRRMVKDEHIREVRAAAGKMGGNPDLLKQKDKQTAKQAPTPSSSLSSSSSSSDEPEGVKPPPPAADVGGAYVLEGVFEGHDTAPDQTPNPVARFAIALTRAGFQATSMNPKLIAYVKGGGTVEHLLAIAAMPECAGTTAGYVIGYAIRELTAPKVSLPQSVAIRNQSAASEWLAQEDA